MAETAVSERKCRRAPWAKARTFHHRVEALEGLVAVVAGALAGSISLVGFGIDSFIEVTSGSVLLCVAPHIASLTMPVIVFCSALVCARITSGASSATA